MLRSTYRADRPIPVSEKLVLFFSDPLTNPESTRQILIAEFQTWGSLWIVETLVSASSSV
jgi:hypothetical protein